MTRQCSTKPLELMLESLAEQLDQNVSVSGRIFAQRRRIPSGGQCVERYSMRRLA